MEATITKKVNSRLDATTAAAKLLPLDIGAKINVVGLKFGENYQGSNLWYMDDQNMHYTAKGVNLNLQNSLLSTLVDFPSLWNIANKVPLKIGIYDSGVTTGNTLFANRVT